CCGLRAGVPHRGWSFRLAVSRLSGRGHPVVIQSPYKPLRPATSLVGNLAGAKVLRQGEFKPGFPFVYIEDPDGHTIEIWFE
ncbi:MAG: hypothetical protein VCC04_16705, partial [Myxococcota bacterium]